MTTCLCCGGLLGAAAHDTWTSDGTRTPSRAGLGQTSGRATWQVSAAALDDLPAAEPDAGLDAAPYGVNDAGSGSDLGPIWVESNVLACCNVAYERARARGYPEVVLFDLLYAIAGTPTLAAWLAAYDVDGDLLRIEIEAEEAGGMPPPVQDCEAPRTSTEMKQALIEARVLAARRLATSVTIGDVLAAIGEGTLGRAGDHLAAHMARERLRRRGGSRSADPSPFLRVEPIDPDTDATVPDTRVDTGIGASDDATSAIERAASRGRNEAAPTGGSLEVDAGHENWRQAVMARLAAHEQRVDALLEHVRISLAEGRGSAKEGEPASAMAKQGFMPKPGPECARIGASDAAIPANPGSAAGTGRERVYLSRAAVRVCMRRTCARRRQLHHSAAQQRAQERAQERAPAASRASVGPARMAQGPSRLLAQTGVGSTTIRMASGPAPTENGHVGGRGSLLRQAPQSNLSGKSRDDNRAGRFPGHPLESGRPLEDDDGDDLELGQPAKRFYLSMDDDIVEAPSIGPKTAERLREHGIGTVRDLLSVKAQALSVRLGVRHITAERITSWQHQARLVCTIPYLRGTHAQILVGSGYYAPHSIVAANRDALCTAILRFSTTREGQSVLRSAPPPSLGKIMRWVEQASLAETDRAA